MPMPRINSGELCVALERVAHIAVEDNELGALSLWRRRSRRRRRHRHRYEAVSLE